MTETAAGLEPSAGATGTGAKRPLLARVKRGLIRRVTITMPRWDTARICPEVAGVRIGGARLARQYRLDDPAAMPTVGAPTVHVAVPDPASLARLVASGLLRGSAADVRVHLDRLPPCLRHGITLPRVDRDGLEVSFRVRRGGAEVRVASRGRRDLAQRLARIADALQRPGRWDRAGGDLYALDRSGWLSGQAPRARGRTDAAATPTPEDGSTAAGPFAPTPALTRAAGPDERWPVGAAVANPYGRRLLGAADPLRLDLSGETILLRRAHTGAEWLTFSPTHSAEHALLGRQWEKYAVLDLGESPAVLGSRFGAYVVDTLAACGVVLASRSPLVREQLTARGLPSVADATDVRDLAGYRLSVTTANRALVDGDDTLRHTPLAGGTLELPTISVLVASKRSDELSDCLGYLAAQTYPAYEIVVGTHGYSLPAPRIAELIEKSPVPVRFVALADTLTLGEVLGALSRRADGELLTKVDDDDPYAPNHLTDLFLAWHTSGADLVAKSARFVYFADQDKTIDRAWAAPESFDVTPAGGTLLLARGALEGAGGWSRSPRQVDADLVTRVRAAGGMMYRTHGLGYVYVRHAGGHTFRTDDAALLEQGESVWDGIPQPLLAAYDEPTDAMTRA